MHISEDWDHLIADTLADELRERGLIEAAELDRVRRIRSETRERLDRILTKLGLVSERDMAQALSVCLDLPLAAAEDYPAEPLFADEVAADFLKQARMLPLACSPDGVAVAVADPIDLVPLEALRLRLGRPVLPRVGLPEDIEAAHERLYGRDGNGYGQFLDAGGAGTDADTGQDIERLRDLASEAPVIRLVNLIIGKAVEARASDIHIEPFERRLRVRYRVDGVLRDAESPPGHLGAAIVSRIKIMARLNIAETRLPQDGRIKQAIRGKEIDLRVSTVPAMHGECVVLRILDRGAVALEFASLGMAPAMREAYLGILVRPHGILLVTGPTGSGKTTTLYTSLLHLNTGQSKILTAEDPIEYQLDGINQVQVKSQIGLDFAALLRTFLRQDPDIIMIGEIRDLETAQIAAQAALTGHLVLSTLHTNDAASTVTRLLDMGVDDYLIASTLNGVLAQRLARKLCTDCREAYEPPAETVAQLGQQNSLGDTRPVLFRPAGCDNCAGTGYRGRTSILELLVMSDELRALVVRHAEAHEIRRAACAAGMRSIYHDGLAKAVSGETSLQEVMRVTNEI